MKDKKVAPPRADIIEKLEWEPVISTNLDQLAWHATDVITTTDDDDERLGWLFVVFRSSYVYAYPEVPECLVNVIRGADSAGEAFNKLVKDHYEAVRIDRGRAVTRS